VSYGVLIKTWPLIVANGCAVVMASLVLVMKWRFRRGRGTPVDRSGYQGDLEQEPMT
jgi:hypothetical protein